MRFFVMILLVLLSVPLLFGCGVKGDPLPPETHPKAQPSPVDVSSAKPK
jgi:hypothetical protein